MRLNKTVFALCVSAVLLLAGCGGSDEGAIHYENKLFISATNFAPRIAVDVTDATTGSLSRPLGVKMAAIEGRDVNVTVSVDPGRIEYYREVYGDKSAVVLPEKYYTLAGGDMTIKSGTVTSQHNATVNFTGMEALTDLSAHNYILPVTITNADLDVLERSKTMFYVVGQAALVNVVADLGVNMRLAPGPTDWVNPDPLNGLSKFTLETLVLVHAFDNREIASVMGIEETFLVRIGDSGLPREQLQVTWGNDQIRLKDPNLPNGPATGYFPKAGGKIPDGSNSSSYPQMKLTKGTWNHIAVTFDEGLIIVYINGVAVASAEATLGATTGGTLTFVDFARPREQEDGYMIPQPNGQSDYWFVYRYFFVGYSVDAERPLNGRMAETRIWNKVLTAEDINGDNGNHMYKVDPASDGLVAYWKFNDGEGNIVKDYSVNENDLYAESTGWKPANPTSLQWFDVALPAK